MLRHNDGLRTERHPNRDERAPHPDRERARHIPHPTIRPRRTTAPSAPRRQHRGG